MENTRIHKSTKYTKSTGDIWTNGTSYTSYNEETYNKWKSSTYLNLEKTSLLHGITH